MVSASAVSVRQTKESPDRQSLTGWFGDEVKRVAGSASWTMYVELQSARQSTWRLVGACLYDDRLREPVSCRELVTVHCECQVHSPELSWVLGGYVNVRKTQKARHCLLL
jgi:hypothetical protein